MHVILNTDMYLYSIVCIYMQITLCKLKSVNLYCARRVQNIIHSTDREPPPTFIEKLNVNSIFTLIFEHDVCKHAHNETFKKTRCIKECYII